MHHDRVAPRKLKRDLSKADTASPVVVRHELSNEGEGYHISLQLDLPFTNPNNPVICPLCLTSMGYSQLKRHLTKGRHNTQDLISSASYSFKCTRCDTDFDNLRKGNTHVTKTCNHTDRSLTSLSPSPSTLDSDSNMDSDTQQQTAVSLSSDQGLTSSQVRLQEIYDDIPTDISCAAPPREVVSTEGQNTWSPSLTPDGVRGFEVCPEMKARVVPHDRSFLDALFEPSPQLELRGETPDFSDSSIDFLLESSCCPHCKKDLQGLPAGHIATHVGSNSCKKRAQSLSVCVLEPIFLQVPPPDHPFKCPAEDNCRSFSTFRLLHQHTTNHHQRDLKLSCCDDAFSDEQSARAHFLLAGHPLELEVEDPIGSPGGCPEIGSMNNTQPWASTRAIPENPTSQVIIESSRLPEGELSPIVTDIPTMGDSSVTEDIASGTDSSTIYIDADGNYTSNTPTGPLIEIANKLKAVAPQVLTSPLIIPDGHMPSVETTPETSYTTTEEIGSGVVPPRPAFTRTQPRPKGKAAFAAAWLARFGEAASLGDLEHACSEFSEDLLSRNKNTARAPGSGDGQAPDNNREGTAPVHPKKRMPPPAMRIGGARHPPRMQLDPDVVRDATRLQKLYRFNRKKAFKEILGKKSDQYTGGKSRAETYFKDIHSDRPLDLHQVEALMDEIDIPIADDHSSLREFTPEEVIARLRRMTNSSPGKDKIDYNTLKKSDPKGDILATLFNKCLSLRQIPSLWKEATTVLIHKKGDLDDPANFRPIALQVCIYKLYAALLADQIQSWAITNQLISPEQKGFMPSQGCYEHTFLLNNILHYDSRRNSKRVLLSWLDLANAFGSVPHEVIHTVVKRMGLPEHMRDLLRQMYTGSTSTFKTTEGETKLIDILAGVKQGCPLSPILFNMVMELLIRKVKQVATRNGCYRVHGMDMSILAYADDLVLVASSPEMLQELLNIIGISAETLGLRFNASKCATLHYNRSVSGAPLDSMVVTDDAFVCQQQRVPCLQRAESYRYLGVPMGIDIGDKSLPAIVDQCREEILKIENSRLAPWQKLDAIRTFVQPKLTFALRAGVNDLKASLKELDTTLRFALRRICNLPTRATTSYLFADRRTGGLGFQNPGKEYDIQKVVQAVAMYNSPDANIKNIAMMDIGDACRLCETDMPEWEAACQFLSGSVTDGFENYQHNDIKRSVFSTCRMAARRLKIGFSIIDGQLSVVLNGDKVVSPSSTCKALHDHIRGEFTQELMAKRDQGKVANSINGDPYQNASSWLFTGKGIRFCDWRFIHRARLNLTPTNHVSNKFRQGATDADRLCRHCKDSPEYLAHALNHCKTMMVPIRRRHDLIQDRLIKARTDSPIARTIQTDMAVKSMFPQITANTGRPDIVVREGNKITIIDVAVAFDNGKDALEAARVIKEGKYRAEADQLRLKGFDVEVHGFVLGSLGSWHTKNEAVLNRLGVQKGYRALMRKLMCLDVIKGSRDIWTEFVTGHRQY